VLKELAQHTFHSFPAVNTLFNGLAESPRLQHGGLESTSRCRWAAARPCKAVWPSCGLRRPGCPICEGYGLSETSPSASCNAVTATQYTGTIGVPLPSTYMKLLDDDGHEVRARSAG